MVDRERLEAMRAFAAEVREDLERREVEDPIVEISNDRVVSDSRETAAPLVFKTNENALSELYADRHNSRSAADQPPFDDFQIDVLAAAIAQLRADLDVTALMQRVAVLEGQVQTLLTLLGGDANQRSIEASEVVRKLKVQR